MGKERRRIEGWEEDIEKEIDIDEKGKMKKIGEGRRINDIKRGRELDLKKMILIDIGKRMKDWRKEWIERKGKKRIDKRKISKVSSEDMVIENICEKIMEIG